MSVTKTRVYIQLHGNGSSDGSDVVFIYSPRVNRSVISQRLRMVRILLRRNVEGYKITFVLCPFVPPSMINPIMKRVKIWEPIGQIYFIFDTNVAFHRAINILI